MSAQQVSPQDQDSRPPLSHLLNAERPLSAMIALRFGFFTLLTYDLWTISLSHAPRYGVASFNTAHLPLLDIIAPLPTPALIGALYLTAGALSLCIAIGLAGRLGVVLCASLYSFAYFWSQADSYQHHYLLCLFLCLFIGTPWRFTPTQRKSSATVQGLSVNILFWQLSFIYAWTALAKCDLGWLSGETLRQIITDPDLRAGIDRVASTLEITSHEAYRVLAWGVMLGEWFAAIAVLYAPLRSLAFWIVPWFHVGVEWIGFDIELFSYYMILLNITLLGPHWLWKPVESMRVYLQSFLSRGTYSERVRLSVTFGSVILLSYILANIEIEGAGYSAGLSAVLGGVAIAVEQRRRALTFRVGLMSALLSVIALGSTLQWGANQVNSPSFRFDYYRLWAGDLKRRGQRERAYQTYLIANQAQAPDLPARFIQLGELAERLDKPGALEAFQEGARRRSLAYQQALNLWRSYPLIEQLNLHSLGHTSPGSGNKFPLPTAHEVARLRDLYRDLSRRTRSVSQALKKLRKYRKENQPLTQTLTLREMNRQAIEVRLQWVILHTEHQKHQFFEKVHQLETQVAEQPQVNLKISSLKSQYQDLISELTAAQPLAQSLKKSSRRDDRLLDKAEYLARLLKSSRFEIESSWSAIQNALGSGAH